MHDKVNTDLYTLNDWFRANQLSVNSSKTKYILFSKYGNVLTNGMFLHIDNEHIERVQATKFLGIHIDEHITWEHHINHCKKKLSQGVYAINKSKHILSQKHLKILYYSLVHPYLLYGIRLWGSALKRLIGKLEIAQKKAMRTMTGARYNDPSSPLFKRLSILKLKDLFEQQIKLFMYDFVNKVLPEPLLGIYEYHGDIHGHETRHSTDPKPPNVNTELMRRSYGWHWICILRARTPEMSLRKEQHRHTF